MLHLKSYEELNESGSGKLYDPEKYYSYNYVTTMLRKAPAYMRKELDKLRPENRKNNQGKEILMTKISERLFNFLFNKHW